MRKNPEGFKVHIYARDHRPPHCHVTMPNRDSYRITIPLLEEMNGKKIPKKVSDYLLINIDELADEWDTINPQPKYTEKT